MALPLGLAAAVWRNTWWDRWISGWSYVFLSIPEFFLALMAVFFAAQTGWFPTSGRTSLIHDFLSPLGQFWDSLWHLILPAFVLGLSNVARLFRLMRGYVLDFLRAEFVTTARAKGVSEIRILFRHVLPNALNPLITHFGFALAGLLSGSLLVENVFNYPGLGQLIFEAFMAQDQFVVMASVVVGGAMLMCGNLVADLLLMGVDPRIREE
jgi:peptide/nickel transport system permease protein